MSTIYKILDSAVETLGEFIAKYNNSLENLNNDKLEASDIVGKQDTLVSGTNIRTINGNTLLGSTDLVIPTLTDGDKGDITLSSSASVWTIDNDVVTFAKMQNVTGDRIIGRVSGTSGDIGELTGTQVNTILPEATTSLKGLLSASDKSSIDAMDKWTLVKNDSFTAGTPYDSGTLTTYDLYKIVFYGAHTAGSSLIKMRINNVSTGASYNYMTRATNGSSTGTTSANDIEVYSSGLGSGYIFRGIYEIERATNSLFGNGSGPFNVSSNSILLQNAHVATSALTSIQLSTINNISGNIKIYGRNY